jgi:hypothetical protein
MEIDPMCECAELLEATRIAWAADPKMLALFDEVCRVVQSGAQLTEDQECLFLAMFCEPDIPGAIAAANAQLVFPF